MMPWGHVAVAVLPYAAYRLAVSRSLPERGAVLFLAVAAQFPDLVDKPLAWGLHVLPSGRSLAHSVLVAVPVVLVVGLVAWRRGHAKWGALFALGYLSHLYADFYSIVLRAPVARWPVRLANLYWPLVPLHPHESTRVASYFARVPPSHYVWAAVGLVGLVSVYAWPVLGWATTQRE